MCALSRVAGKLGLGVSIVFVMLAGSASTARADGAYVAKDSYCFPLDDGRTVCYANRVVANSVTTGSGNEIFFAHGESLYTERSFSGELLFSDTLTYRTNGLNKEGTLQRMGQWFKTTVATGVRPVRPATRFTS